MKDLIGEVFKSNSCGEFKVIDKIKHLTRKKWLYKVEFNTGYSVYVEKHCILSGEIKDPYCKNICGVACFGVNKGDNFLYARWIAMIKRCYNMNTKPYKHYGAKGIVVCDRWLCFEYYNIDVKKLKGYDEELVKNGILHLDKDILIKDNKIYSPKTCI